MAINIADNSPRVNYTATSGQTVFTVSFEFFEEADLSVYINGTEKTITTDYTVSGGDGSTGTVTLTSGATAGDKVAIVRDVSLQRTSDFTEGAAISRAALNEQLDIITAQIADVDDKASRALQLNDHEVAVSITLPATDDRKGKILGFNASTGAVEAGPTLADTQSLADISADIATLADIEDGTDATDAIQTVAGISSNVSTVAGISANVTTVAGITSNIASVVADEADIGVVAGISSDVSTVSAISTDVTTVAADGTDIGVVAGISSDVTTVSGISTDVTTVSSISSNVTTVAGNSASITTVAGNSSNVTIVADNITDVNTVASNIGSITTKVSKSGDTMTGNLLFDDTSKVLLGTRSNLQIYHSATAITASNITLYFTNGSTSGTMEITDTDHTISVSDTVRVDSPEILNSTPVTVSGVVLSSLQQDLTVSATTATTFTVPVTYASDPGTTGTLGQAGTYYYYTGSATSYISEQGAGSLHVLGSEINVYNADETSQLAQFSTTATKLFHNNSEKLTTTATGISLPEDLTVQGNLTVQGTTITVDSASAQTVDLGDNDKIRLGDGDDLQIFHLSANNSSYIQEQNATGSLYIEGADVYIRSYSEGDNMIIAERDGAVTLHYDNSAKLATTSTGVDITGTLTSDGLTVDTDTLHVDAANNRVGIGTSSPTTALTVSTDGTEQLTINRADASINTGNSVGTILFTGDDPSANQTGARIQVIASQNWSTNQYGSHITFSNDNSGTITERMRIDNSGYIISTASNPQISFVDSANSSYKWSIQNTSSAIRFYDNTASSEAMRITSSGQVGIGTTSPSGKLDVSYGDYQNSGAIKIGADLGQNTSRTDASRKFGAITAAHFDNDEADLGLITMDSSSASVSALTIGGGSSSFSSASSINFQTSSDGSSAGTTAMRIDSSGVVNIKNTGSTADFISETATSFIVGDGTGAQAMTVYTGTASNGAIYFADGSTGNATYRGGVQYLHGSDAMRFFTSATEVMRIDSSGNLLVGKTALGYNTSSGTELWSNGFSAFTRDNAVVSYFNRKTSDGDLVQFLKDGTTVGSIGSDGGSNLVVKGSGNSAALLFNHTNARIEPYVDNVTDLGRSLVRFKDLYLSGGVYLGGTGSANKLTRIYEFTGTTDGSGNANLSYPTGFVKDDTHVISAKVLATNGVWRDGYGGDAPIVYLGSNVSLSASGYASRPYRIVIADIS